jgi:hypothetical protein
MGAFDWLTTMIGVVFFGATEVNPLFAGLTQSSMLLFSVAKLSAVAAIGSAFYLAMGGAIRQIPSFSSRFMYSGYAISLIALTTLVVNNISVIVRLL